MGVVIGTKIIPSDIVNLFITKVKNRIISGCNDINNKPYLDGHQCVPSNILGNLNEIEDPVIGSTNGRINAEELYDALVNTTHVLTRVGTWQYNIYLKTDGGRRLKKSKNGTAFYTIDKIRDLSPVSNPNVKSGNKITANDIIELMNSCYVAWNTTSKYHHYDEYQYCHSSCHGSCHGNCNCNATHIDCYNNMGGAGGCDTCHTDDYSQCNRCDGDRHEPGWHL